MNLEWNVIYYNSNKNIIEEWNIFKHNTYKAEVEELLNNYKSKKEFASELDRSTMYHFWCKAEYEFIASGWTQREGSERKIDIYTQLKMNWERYVDYLWKTKYKN